VENVLTLAAAGIATGVAVNGMWRVFGDALGFTGPGRVALAGFLEIALMVSALRARRSLREHGTVGVDGAAVWAMAGLSAVLAASDAQGLARAVRFAAPLVAAWLWERGMAADRRAHHGPGQVIAWRLTRQRIAVWAGLADPAERDTTDVDRRRRLARLTRARLRLAVLETSRLPKWLDVATARPLRKAWAAWRLQRQALAAVEYLALGSDPAVTATITMTVAAVVGLPAATTPAALAHRSPWTAIGDPGHVPELDQGHDPSGDLAGDPVSDPVDGPRRLTAVTHEATRTDRIKWARRRATTVGWEGMQKALVKQFAVSPSTAKRDVQAARPHLGTAHADPAAMSGRPVASE
jgi:hypothetical protein